MIEIIEVAVFKLQLARQIQTDSAHALAELHRRVIHDPHHYATIDAVKLYSFKAFGFRDANDLAVKILATSDGLSHVNGEPSKSSHPFVQRLESLLVSLQPGPD